MTDTPVMPMHMQRTRFDPVDELVRARDEEGVRPVTTLFGTGYLITRYEDAREVLSDPVRFSNARFQPFGAAGDQLSAEERAEMRAGQLLALDPPDHTRLRHMLTPEFTVRRMNRLKPRIEEIVSAALDDVEQAGKPADLVSTFALPVPSLVICELLGVPYSDRDEFQRLSRARLDMSLDIEDRVAAGDEARAYMAGLVAQQRRSPGDGMLGMLVREHGDEIDDVELTGVADLLLLAGHETTSNMLGLGTLLLLREPDQLAIMRDPSRVDNAVEELLRYLSVLHTVVPRMALVDVTLDGHDIKAGELVLCSLPAANRDPSLGDDLDHVDLTRAVTTHVAFGHGIHHCLGAPLARMEMRIAYPALFDRFPTLRLAVPFDEVPFRAFSVVYGLSALPVEW